MSRLLLDPSISSTTHCFEEVGTASPVRTNPGEAVASQLSSPASPRSGEEGSSDASSTSGASEAARPGSVARAGRATPPTVLTEIRRAAMGLLMLPARPLVGCADAVDFENRKDLLEQIAKIIDPVIAAIGAEAAEHSHEICSSYFENFLSAALDDRVLSQFESAADRLRDEEDEACEPQGSARARDAMED